MKDLSQYQLQAADLEDVLAAAQAAEIDDTPAMNELVRRFDPLAKRLARSLTECPYLRDDLANSARIALVRAARKHDLGRQGFPSYAEQFMRGAVLREYRSWMTSSDDASLDEVVTSIAVSEAEVTEAEVLDRLAPWGDGALAAAITTLTLEQIEIAEWRYVDDEELSTIASTTRTTVSAVSQRLATIHRRIEVALAA